MRVWTAEGSQAKFDWLKGHVVDQIRKTFEELKIGGGSNTQAVSVEGLQERVSTLEAKVAALEARLDALARSVPAR